MAVYLYTIHHWTANTILVNPQHTCARGL